MLLTSIVQAAACLYVFHISVLALNRMNAHTAHLIRYGYIALAGGSAAGILSGFVLKDLLECLFAVGVAIYIAVERRHTAVPSTPVTTKHPHA